MKNTIKLPDGVVITTEKPEFKKGQPWIGYVHPKHIEPNPHQPRETFPEEDQESLKKSGSVVGQQEAISVIPYENEQNPDIWFKLHNGERRWRAVTDSKSEAILTVYNPIVDRDNLTFLSFVANFGSKGHTHQETIKAVWNEVKVKGRSVKDFAYAVTRSEVWVNDYLALRNLHPELKVLMDPPTPKGRRLPFSLALTIAKAQVNDQIEIFKKTAGLSAKVAIREARKLVTEDNRVQGRKRVSHDDWKIVKRILGTFNEDLNYLLGLDPQVFKGVSFDNDLIAASLESIMARVAIVYKRVTDKDLPAKPNAEAMIRLAVDRHNRGHAHLDDIINANGGRAACTVS